MYELCILKSCLQLSYFIIKSFSFLFVMPATFLLYYQIVLVFSPNMTWFKNYSYLIEDRKVLKSSIHAWRSFYTKNECREKGILDS